jgi:hypothetical protein
MATSIPKSYQVLIQHPAPPSGPAGPATPSAHIWSWRIKRLSDNSWKVTGPQIKFTMQYELSVMEFTL